MNETFLDRAVTVDYLCVSGMAVYPRATVPSTWLLLHTNNNLCPEAASRSTFLKRSSSEVVFRIESTEKSIRTIPKSPGSNRSTRTLNMIDFKLWWMNDDL